jgi:hypothetical protein
MTDHLLPWASSSCRTPNPPAGFSILKRSANIGQYRDPSHDFAIIADRVVILRAGAGSARVGGLGLCLGRWLSKLHQYAVAQSLRIALAGFCKLYDLLRENFVCQIATVSEFKRDQSHLERQTHDADSFRIEFLTV